MSTEERHQKQKEKLMAKGENKEEKREFTPQPYFKQVVVNECNKNGFDCFLNNDAVIVFTQVDRENEIKDWLLKHFGKAEQIRNPFNDKELQEVTRIPFSFGFAESKSIPVSQRPIKVEIEDLDEEEEEIELD